MFHMRCLWLTLLVLPLVVGGNDYSDLKGPYCEARTGGCCPGRQDNCAQPILGTLCYCDDFCNRTRQEDCCPDFWSHCKGIAPPIEIVSAVCTLNGRNYNNGETITVNCNKCKCDVIDDRPEFLCEKNDCMINPEILTAVNADRALGWTAANYSEFWGRYLEDGVTLKLGTLQPHKAVMRMTPVKRVYDALRLPRHFDARTKWRGLVQGVADQGWCGASWAVSTASVASDRFAIMSNGTETVTLAPNHLLSCNGRGQRGCAGGHLDRAWLFMRKFGIVEESCYPYVAGSGSVGNCRIPKRGGNLLTARCPPSRDRSPSRTDMYHMGPAYKMGSEQDIMHEIQTSGPVQATMRVTQDFFSYRGGIYRSTLLGAAHRTGYHSVRVVGWGEENTGAGLQKYWLVANSWGPFWGENGYFRIRRGVDESEIEQFVLASWAQESRTIPKGTYVKPTGEGNAYSNDLN